MTEHLEPWIWDLETLRKVQRQHVEGWVTKELLSAEFNAWVELRYQFGRALSHIGKEELGVEISQLDIEIREIQKGHTLYDPTGEYKDIVQAQGRWHPMTNGVLFLGGSMDGRISPLQSVTDNVRCPVIRPVARVMDDKVPMEPDLDIDEYALSGWSEKGNWVYSLVDRKI